MPGRLGVCSWSLQPRSPDDLVAKVRACGLDAVQLALTPLAADERALEATLGALRGAGIEVRSGMLATAGEDYASLESIRRTGGVRPDARWAENLARARSVADVAARAGIGLVSFHAGFLPEERGSQERATMIGRLREIADLFAAQDVRIALETGQERAEVLLEVLAELDRPSCGVNFDPANMILYGMGDPIAALAALAPRVLQVHVKDARRTKIPGTWGEEVPVGTGEVDWAAFARVLAENCPRVDRMIEREAGSDRVGDIRAAARHEAFR